LRAAGAIVLATSTHTATLAAEAAPWVQAGRQGIIRMVIVPLAQAQDRAAYDLQIAALCSGQETCFINFFTNSTNAEVALPLPDAIDKEATAVLRRSAKQGVDSFRWSCRLKRPETDCF
jgi:hypothetical protein